MDRIPLDRLGQGALRGWRREEALRWPFPCIRWACAWACLWAATMMLVRLTSLGIDLRRRGGADAEMSGRCKGHEAMAEDVSSAREGLHGTWRVQMCCVVPEQVDATSTFGRLLCF